MLRVFLVLTICFFLGAGFAAGESYEFVQRDVDEILFAVSLYKGFPVTGDDTVKGKADFRCGAGNFDDAFDTFLMKSRLYVDKQKDKWLVSKVRIQKKIENDEELFCVDAYDVMPLNLLEKVGIECGVCVTYDSLPGIPVNIHTGFCSVEEIVKRICSLCSGFEFEKKTDGVFHVSRISSKEALGSSSLSGKADFALSDDGFWFCDVQNAQISYVAEKMFALAGKKFCFVNGSEGKIFRAHFSGKTFDDSLSILCAQAGVEFSLCDDIYVLGASKKAKEKLNGSDKVWKKYRLKNIKSNDFIAGFSKRFSDVELVCFNDGYTFFYRCNDAEEKEILAFVEACDLESNSWLVQLQFLRTSDFLANLPPYVDKNCVKDSGKGDSFFFTGTEETYRRLLKELETFDSPAPRITYDLLIMQYQKTDNDEWNPSLGLTKAVPGDVNGANVQLGSVMSLNLDVVGAFGLKFAGELQAAISNSRAHVFADTTLNGVSGSTINFQNTNTFRYRDNNLDPETGKPVYSGVTREIVSGLKLEVTGVVTGDGLITSKITASVSRQGADTSSKTGNPPPSSEKIITTEVRSRSGEPVILSGLVQTEETQTVSRTPYLSRIPVIGWFFKGEEKTKEQTELVIYLVPKVSDFAASRENEKQKYEERIEKAYKEFVADVEI